MTRFAGIRVLGTSLVLALTACGPAVDDTDTAATANARSAYSCGAEGRLEGQLYGGIRADIDWDRTAVTCEGMARPDGDGVRLRFAGKIEPGGQQIAMIIALPDFAVAATNSELPANVTLIEEGNGRFFSTPDLDNCLADIGAVVATGESASRYTVTGTLYCVSPLPEVNGDSSVSVPELSFTGIYDGGAS